MLLGNFGAKFDSFGSKHFKINIFKVLEFHFPPILTLDNTILDNTILSKNVKIAAPYLAPSLINIHICMV